MTEFLPENPVLPQDAGRQLPLSVIGNPAECETPRPAAGRGSLVFRRAGMTLLFRIPDTALVEHAKIASLAMLYDGRPTPAATRHIRRCTHFHRPTETLIIFTRDGGMHSSGWWKNPDYERCLHLSLSFAAVDRDGVWPLPFDHRMAEKWARVFFGDEVRRLWIEPPFSDEGKARGVHHYRLFCDQAWQPIVPRGEVYSKRFTPADWKSWSDVHGAENGDGEFGRVIQA